MKYAATLHVAVVRNSDGCGMVRCGLWLRGVKCCASRCGGVKWWWEARLPCNVMPDVEYGGLRRDVLRH